MLKRLFHSRRLKQRDSHRELVEAIEIGTAFITKWGEIRIGGNSGDFERSLTVNDDVYLNALKLMRGEKTTAQREHLTTKYLQNLLAELSEPRRSFSEGPSSFREKI